MVGYVIFFMLWTLRRKIHMTWSPRRNLGTSMDSLWSNKIELSASYTMLSSNTQSLESTIIREFLVSSFDQWTKTHSIQCFTITNQDAWCWPIRTSRFRPIRSVQILILRLHRLDLIRNLGGDFNYKRWPPLCLWRKQFRLLPESVSLGLRLLLLKSMLIFFTTV